MNITRRFLWANAPGAAFAIAAIWIPEAFGAGLVYHGALLILVFADALLGVSPAWITVSRQVAAKLSLNDKALVSVHVRNRSSRALQVEATDIPPEQFQFESLPARLALGPFQEDKFEYRVIPMRRGTFAFGDVWFRVYCPMGLASRSFCKAAGQEVHVYPNLEGIRRAELMGRKNLLAQMGIHRLRFAGQGSEFEQLREYTRGDDFKRINWKATARMNKPITTEFQLERSQNVLLCLDVSHMMAAAAGQLTKLDHAANAAALLAHTVLSSGDRAGIVVFAHKVLTFLPPSQGVKQMNRILEILREVQPIETRADYLALSEFLAVHGKRRSLLAIFTDLIDTQQGEELVSTLRVLRGRHLPLCLTFRDTHVQSLTRIRPDNAAEMFTLAIAVEVARARSELLRDLTHLGAEVLDVLPHELSVQSVNRYLQLKARQRL